MLSELNDGAFDDIILEHLRKCQGSCSDNKYTNCNEQLAKHITRTGDLALAARIKKRLFAMRDMGRVKLTTVSGGICTIELIDHAASNGHQPVEAAAAVVAEMMDAPVSPAAEVNLDQAPATITTAVAKAITVEVECLRPLMKAYRLLILSWLIANNGLVESKSGTVSSMFRDKFGLEATASVRQMFSGTILWMVKAGEISHQKCPDLAVEHDNPVAWHNSKKTFSIKLLVPMAAGELTKLADALEGAKARAGATQKNVAKTESAQVIEATPVGDVLIANEEDLEALAMRVHADMIKAHAALWAAAQSAHEKPVGSIKWYAISGRAVLSDAGFTALQMVETRHYLRLLGICAKEKANNKTWWWRIPEDPPKYEAVYRQVAKACNIFDPRRVRVQTEPTTTTVSPTAQPAHWRGAPHTLGTHQVGTLRTSVDAPASEPAPTPRPAPPATKPIVAPEPEVVVAVVPDQDTSLAIHELMIEQLTAALDETQKELTAAKDGLIIARKEADDADRLAKEAQEEVRALRSQLEALSTPAMQNALELMRRRKT